MRPVILDVDGFGSYRGSTTLDLRKVDHFALVGPTGSGKSTLLDAMVFALYGTIPRLGAKAVSGALSPTATEGKVRLVFDVGGSRYVATRVLRRTAAGGATVKEARLERLGDTEGTGSWGERLDPVGEPGVRGMDRAVEELLGLSYEHFTRAVILPQGDFAQLLHARKSEREDILQALLGLSAYEEMGRKARERARIAEGTAQVQEGQLQQLSHATPEALEAAQQAERRARALAARVPGLVQTVRLAEEAHAASRVERDRVTAERGVLTAVSVPDSVAGLAERVRQAAALEGETLAAVAATEDADRLAGAALVAAGDPAVLAGWQHQHRQRHDAEQLLARRENELQAAEATLVPAAAAVDQATQARDEAETAYEHARAIDVAGTLRPHLVAGEPCPVCEQTVTTLPSTAVDSGLLEAQQRAKEADATVREAERELTRGRAVSDQARSAVDEAKEQVESLSRALSGAPDAADVTIRLDEYRRAKQHAEEARSALESDRRDLEAARKARRELDAADRQSRAELAQARDRLVAFGAPPLMEGDLAEAWQSLVSWATAEAGLREQALAQATDAVDKTAAAVAGARTTVSEALAAEGLSVPADRLVELASTVAATAAEKAAHAAAQLQSDYERVRELTEQVSELRGKARVAELLGQLLAAHAFRSWLSRTALDALLVDASETLRTLSGGQYTMALDSGSDSFVVVDHFDADSVRPVKSLSGGETFQASLSLALALSAHLAQLAPAGVRLETLLLDEGFGTLDADSLDLVASTLEELAASGDRLVGVVTHVAALAERTPVRFQVTRAHATSAVERVEE